MKVFKMTLIAAAVASVVSPLTAQAADTLFDNFTPLASSAGVATNAAAPITLSNPGFTQISIAERTNQNTQVPGSNSGNWDMITANETGPNAGRYLFMPFETGTGGVQRIDLQDANYNTRTTTIVAPGTQGFVSGDASRWTPWGSYLTAEESWGTNSTKGRLFEVTNATTATANGGNFVQRSVVPHVSHEGLAFDSNNSLYFVDELNGGGVFKYVSANPLATTGDDFFAAGQTFVMKVGAGSQFEGNNGPAITGGFTWEAITSASGSALAGVSVLAVDGNIDGRASAAAVAATGYNRPEDLEIQNLGGNQLIYFATTDSDNNANTTDGRSRVYNFNVATNSVSLFADSNTIDLATGLAVGGGLRNADNLAIDAEGNIYIIEDRDGAVDDDIWFAKDLNKDGDLLDAGEGLARWASNGTPGSEFTGLYFDKFNANLAYVNIQHPTGGNDRTMMITATPAAVPVPGAVWLFGSAIAGMIGLRRRKA
ncbi:alkaline phosphatase PhoX [Methylomonas rosea]|uniref:DUF839 domain-containing protein n=1 Tax=Methylomonas rosea TaxID=2952227 RepID=A0ABT1TYL5_9GAMM|nr:alkaline phosphatase PhoX [Methylomonas sp. WSC-7]MCQ8119861.1 DUF839 domain-containing protein [Methylomonas sp. WSC-7]